LTAAKWSLNFKMGSEECWFHINSLLSLPPEHNCWSSKDHFNPQTYCLCPMSLLING
jgi:hypothetical protein